MKQVVLLQFAVFWCIDSYVALAFSNSMERKRTFLRPCTTQTQRKRSFVENHFASLQEMPTMRNPLTLQAVENDDTCGDLDEQIQAFLDRPFYDPDAILDSIKDSDDSLKDSIEYRLAYFVKNDYETAEALLVGGYMFVLVLVTQQLVRLIYITGGSHWI